MQHIDFMKLCQQRRSCRSYAPQVIEKEQLDYVLECARLAPSAVNKQPWKVRVVSDRASLEKLGAAYDREWFRTAPMVLAVSVDKAEAWTRQSDDKSHADIDGAILAEHICLAAAAVGLGTCWVCNFDPALCRDLFRLRPDEELVALVPIGYPADEPKPKARKALKEIVEVAEL